MIEPSTLEKCQCGCDTFKIAVDMKYDGLITECTQCGYIETYWFNDTDNE